MTKISAKTMWIGGFAVLSLTIIGTGVAFGKGRDMAKVEETVLGEASAANVVQLATDTAGGKVSGTNAALGVSWPGEIVSYGDVDIQPAREGTIVEWLVNVGQKVKRGQTIARLSAPPAMPEITTMLAEQAKMVSEKRSEAAAMANFAEKNKKQLLVLRASLDQNTKDVNGLFNTDPTSNRTKVTKLASSTVERARSVAEIKQKKVRAVIERALAQEFPEIATYPKDPFVPYRATGYFTTVFNQTIGVLSSETRTQYTDAVFKLLAALKDPSSAPEAEANAYFQAAYRLVLASVSSEEFSEAMLSDLRKMVSMDKTDFLMAMDEAKMAAVDITMKETDAGMKETEYAMNATETTKDLAMQRKEIDEKIAMLERDVEVAQGMARAAEISYGTVARGLTEGLNIVASRDGVVSVIMKKNGDYVMPGMGIASLNSGDASQRFIRFHIPSNLPVPEAGTELTITRPGFPTDMKKVKLIGIGTALDEQGAYVADADLLEPIDWPVRASVRVMPPASVSASLFIPLTAVWWDEENMANVWVVADETVHARRIKTGRALTDSIEVIDGLKDGERYVTKPLPGMKDGTPAAGTPSSGGRVGSDVHGGMDM